MTENGARHDPLKFKSLDQILPLFEPALQKSISHSIEIIEEAFTRYGYDLFLFMKRSSQICFQCLRAEYKF